MKKVLWFLCMVFMSFGLFAVEQKVVFMRAPVENWSYQDQPYRVLGREVDAEVQKLNAEGWKLTQIEELDNNGAMYGLVLLFEKVEVEDDDRK